MILRPMTKAEHKYGYTQSAQIMAQTGCIGHLRGDLGSSGREFHTTWDDHIARLKTRAFMTELDTVINALRFGEGRGGILMSRDVLGRFCHTQPDSVMTGDCRWFGFRTDMDKYTYLFRLNPYRGEYNFYVYCYVRECIC